MIPISAEEAEQRQHRHHRAMVRHHQRLHRRDAPIVRIASISSVISSCRSGGEAAEPERLATMIAVISTPSSRKVIRPTRLDRIDLRAELVELHRAPLRDHHADQEAHQAR